MFIPEPEFITIIEGVNEYAVTLPTGTELNHIIDVFDDKTALQPVSYNELLRRLGDETTKGAPKFYAQRDNTDFYVAPIPNKNDSFRVVYSVKPTATSTSIPDTIGREYREALVHGALYQLQMMAGQPFTTQPCGCQQRPIRERSGSHTPTGQVWI